MSTDKYSSLASLKQHVSSDHYRVRCLDRGSQVTIIAPHGGYIEPGTSALARAIAARTYNLFDFQGLCPDAPWQMHVTATRFRDPALSVLLKTSSVALSVHGMGDQGHDQIWLGGLNYDLKRLTLEALTRQGFTVNADSPRYRGENPQNVVNLACHRGVQLEVPNELMSTLFVARPFAAGGRCPKTTPRFSALVFAVRQALLQYRMPATS